MITITPETNQLITETIEDTVSYICQELASSGELISGETVYKVMECYALTKQAEYQGMFDGV